MAAAMRRAEAARLLVKQKDIQSDVLFVPCERETGIEPAAPTLARWCSTAEPLAHSVLQHAISILSQEGFFVNRKKEVGIFDQNYLRF